MPKFLSINIGFVTNSSSVVYHFPRSLLTDPGIAKFIAAFELDSGFVGSELWSRDTCSTIAMTKEQKQEAAAKLTNTEYGHSPTVNVDDDSVCIIYGDEYESIASTLAHMLKDLADKQGLNIEGYDYN
jgi:hypothetical protein